MAGWIKIYRQITDHWIFDDEVYLKAWITMLIRANHEPSKCVIHGDLMECRRGQSILSLASWTKTFGRKWTIQRVRHFFFLLQKDKMITIEGLTKTTRITICNYDSYQDKQQADNTQTTSKQHSDNIQTTNRQQQYKKGKKVKNEEEVYMSPDGDQKPESLNPLTSRIEKFSEDVSSVINLSMGYFLFNFDPSYCY